MNSKPVTPFGKALLACFEGENAATVIVRRDDGVEAPLPMKYFFRTEDEFSPLEKEVISRCRGKILDIGAGSGIHSLVLQSLGFEVTAIDVSPEAVEVMRLRGIRDVRVADIFSFNIGGFNTLLLMGHGIGMMNDLPGMDKFLNLAHQLLNKNGQILLDSLDVRITSDAKNLAYQEANRQSGRYFGEIRFQMEYNGTTGPYLSWLHVDPETLISQADKTGWHCEILMNTPFGDYLARLTKKNL